MMEMEVSGLILGESNGLTHCAVRITTPSTVEHTPTHYVLLIDTSDSMQDANKIGNVKKCVNLLLNFFKPDDHISLITFGEQSTILLEYAQVTGTDAIKATINAINTDGCTNLSEGLANVSKVLSGRTDSKSALFLLTDGHANRGVSSKDGLDAIITNLKERFPNLSIAITAYGTDHNAELLKGFAEKAQGSYNIVDSLESTAFAFGDALGGIMSTCAQTSKFIVPDGCQVYGPLVLKNNQILIGDVYSGCSPLYLFDVPTAFTGEIKFETVLLPSLECISKTVMFSPIQGRDIEIELVKLRYTCTKILEKVVGFWRLDAEKKAEVRLTFDAFKTALNDSAYNGSPIAELLKAEIPIIEQGLLDRPPADNGYSAHVTQHLTTLGTGRGFTSPAAPRRNVRYRRGSHQPEDPMDPFVPGQGGAPLAATTSVFQNPEQMRVSQLMAAASMAPDEDGTH